MSTAVYSASTAHLSTNGFVNNNSPPSRPNAFNQHMDGRQTEYTQSGLSSPYPSYSGPQSEDSPADQASAAQYTPGQEVRPPNFSSSATPTSDYGINPSSARSGSFPEYIQRSYTDNRQQYHTSGGQSGNAGAMAQSTSPSMSLQDGHNSNHHPVQHMKSDSDVPIDPSIAAAPSPTYPHPNYSPYPPQHDMSHYSGHPAASPMYAARPDWAGHYPQGQQHALSPHYGHQAVSSGAGTPSIPAPGLRPPTGGHPLSTVYSFVPIPGAQQHKRPRRRYEEIERMYKCGWNGCEKAYGTLNHLNAHVTMQSHGAKRTPEEFKEIRKEWKAKKKEEENARKAEEERQRQAESTAAQQGGAQPSAGMFGDVRSHASTPSMGGPQLPPIGYAPASGQAPPQYGGQSAPMENLPQYASSQMYSNNNSANYPQSPYGQSNQIYQQHPDSGSNTFQQ